MKKLILTILICSSCIKDNTHLIKYSARKHNVPEYILLAIAEQETNFNHSAIGKAGEIGMMQIMPYHANEAKCNLRKLSCNIDYSARYLRKMYEVNYSITDAVAKYNAGYRGERTRAGQLYAKQVLLKAEKYKGSV
jgi:soluble lytic murein transglycosylase-like protein